MAARRLELLLPRGLCTCAGAQLAWKLLVEHGSSAKGHHPRHQSNEAKHVSNSRRSEKRKAKEVVQMPEALSNLEPHLAGTKIWSNETSIPSLVDTCWMVF